MSPSSLKNLPFLLARIFLLACIVGGSISCKRSATGSVTVAATAPSEQPQNLPTVQMTIAGKPFVLQLAATAEQREIGLMHRDSMPADQGMIFTFVDEQMQSFWMKKTRIPLDIIYLDRTGKVISINYAKPFDLTGIDSGKPAQYVVELNGGVGAKVGLKPGDTIKVPPEVTAAAR